MSFGDGAAVSFGKILSGFGDILQGNPWGSGVSSGGGSSNPAPPPPVDSVQYPPRFPQEVGQHPNSRWMSGVQSQGGSVLDALVSKYMNKREWPTGG